MFMDDEDINHEIFIARYTLETSFDLDYEIESALVESMNLLTLERANRN